MVQRLHVVLGHPTYALVIVLLGLLLATGIGSALSARAVRGPRAVSVAAGVAALLLFALPHVWIKPMAAMTLGSALWVRALWSGATAVAAGLALGVLFPSGLRYLPSRAAVPMALAVNGLASVLGSLAALIVSLTFGIAASFAAAAVCYLIASALGPRTWPAT